MGFHFRKSFKCGPIRFNLSNSGIGYSVGIKGLRVGVDGKGRNYIGGGKGVLRYRKYVSSNNKANTLENINNSDLSVFNFNNNFIKIMLIIFTIMCTPIFLLYGLLGLFSFSEYSILGLFFLGLYWFILNTAFFSKALKFEKYIKQAATAYNNGNYEQALNDFILADKYKAKNQTWEQSVFIAERIYSCYYKSNNYETALNYVNNSPFISGRREKIVKCYYQMEKWTEVIKLLQGEYTDEEKQEHPSYYALLGEAFLNMGQKEAALEAMLQGPVKKRSMDIEMCSFRYTLGKCFEANNDKANALKQYQKIYVYDTSFEDVAQKIEDLRR